MSRRALVALAVHPSEQQFATTLSGNRKSERMNRVHGTSDNKVRKKHHRGETATAIKTRAPITVALIVTADVAMGVGCCNHAFTFKTTYGPIPAPRGREGSIFAR